MSRKHLMSLFEDFCYAYKQLAQDQVQDMLTESALSYGQYLNLYVPALEWILQCIAHQAPEVPLLFWLPFCRFGSYYCLLVHIIAVLVLIIVVLVLIIVVLILIMAGSLFFILSILIISCVIGCPRDDAAPLQGKVEWRHGPRLHHLVL